ncbi:DUF1993 domain-containing protein [Herbaspirillum sp. WKF16]|uniref:DUF1993 domain-containing protein n=1 Tax=Herbaspirillum sp. WKF16 TaxID=3028312 RepID=UPI0023A92259|nr:DUF1993 domain-containing protein [Herbaspirillum sp. WKF16]WDZ96449.1 DUF1993 domain-containing protein [Herbaspirillum sp. WKF16]
MSITLHQASIPLLIRGLQTLSTLLDKAEQHADEHQLEPAELIGARLFDDMYPLSAQIQRASDTAKATASRLSALAAPNFPDDETSFDELQARIDKTIRFLEGIPADAIDGQETREVKMMLRGEEQLMSGQTYLTHFGLPNFMFHVVTAYGILRHKGVKLGKLDYLGL